MYAFDPSERLKAGHRSREWTAIGDKNGVVRAMARCLQEICRRTSNFGACLVHWVEGLDRGGEGTRATCRHGPAAFAVWFAQRVGP